ncbi:MAG: peptidyl-prolyl cis-trans isomerase [Desulfatitalea sp.]|nr:peptidyl-prolyl cis-trans isomerase [Desulfatitalea sp.]NNK01864.1 peptidyl-prolyl cis-trans isomerase [Desulfatitalea sp.]
MKQLLATLILVFTLACPTLAQDGPRVLIETNKGDILLALDAKTAPKTVANFLRYVESGLYNGTIFHRVIKGFMIQGGGMTGDMQPKPTQAPVINEADNGLKNKVGTIAMARTQDPHSATSQFFINVADNAFLDHKAKSPPGWGYCVFGKVIEGMDVVRAIEKVDTMAKAGHIDVPNTPVVIKRASLASDTTAGEKTSDSQKEKKK